MALALVRRQPVRRIQGHVGDPWVRHPIIAISKREAKREIMKTTLEHLLVAMLIAVSLQTHAQGFVYDQQSTNPPSTLGDYLDIQPSPLTQSFTPVLSAIGFVQFELWDVPNSVNNGATVYVNLWSGSPNIHSATLLGSTTPVYMPAGFGSIFAGVTNFYFALAIALTPGETYYLQPVVQSGDNPFDIWDPGNTYPDGQLYDNGLPGQPSVDLWFREGVVVPEPTTLTFAGLSCILAYAFKRRSKLFIPQPPVNWDSEHQCSYHQQTQTKT